MLQTPAAICYRLERTLNTLLIVVAVVAVVLLLTGGLVPSLNFLLWVGIVVLIIAAIAYFAGGVSRRTRN